MGALFRDARLKIDRAKKHIADMQTAILVLEKSKTATVQRNTETRYQELVHDIPGWETALLNMSLIAGDALHNLRVALDYAWASAIERYVPNAVSGFNKFPVLRTRKEVEAALCGIKIDTACPALFDAVLSEISNVQPYERGQNGVIWALHQLDIFDKHLLLLGLRPFAGIKGIVVKDADGDVVHGPTLGTETAPPYVITFHNKVEIQNKGELVFEVTIEEAGVFKGLGILDLLATFSQYVLYVVQLFEKL